MSADCTAAPPHAASDGRTADKRKHLRGLRHTGRPCDHARARRHPSVLCHHLEASFRSFPLCSVSIRFTRNEASPTTTGHGQSRVRNLARDLRPSQTLRPAACAIHAPGRRTGHRQAEPHPSILRTRMRAPRADKRVRAYVLQPGSYARARDSRHNTRPHGRS